MWRHAWLRRKHAALAKRNQHPALAEYLSTPLPAPTTPWRDADYVSLDIETTGLDPKLDSMLSVGWVDISRGRIELRTARTILVKPEKGVGESATVHGLTDTLVQDGAKIGAVMAEVLAALKGKVLVVHHAKLDKGLLDRLCRDLYGTLAPLYVIDTMAMELRRLSRQHHLSDPHRLRLADLRETYNLPYYAAHDCLLDAIAAGELFLAMVASRPDADTLKLSDLLS